MKKVNLSSHCRAQTAIEYLLILAVVGVVVLASMKFLIPNIQTNSEAYYTDVTRVIMGGSNMINGVNNTPQPIDGGWCDVECPTSGTVGNPTMYRTCECPAPAFGGLYCTDPRNSVTHGGGEVVHCSQTIPTVTCSGTCEAPVPACGQITFGTMSCLVNGNTVQQSCSRQGPPCPH